MNNKKQKNKQQKMDAFQYEMSAQLGAELETCKKAHCKQMYDSHASNKQKCKCDKK